MFENVKNNRAERVRALRDKYRQKKWFLEEFPQDNSEIKKPSEEEQNNIRQIHKFVSDLLRIFGIEIDKIPEPISHYQFYFEQFLGRRARRKDLEISGELKEKLQSNMRGLGLISHTRGEEEYQQKREETWIILEQQLDFLFDVSPEDKRELHDLVFDIMEEERRLRLENK